LLHLVGSSILLYLIDDARSNKNQAQSMNIGNSSFKMAEEFKYLGTTSTNQNSIQDGIISRLKSDNACCHSVQNLLSSNLLSNNIKI